MMLEEKIESWLKRDKNPKTRLQLQQLIKNKDKTELKSCFKGRLSFGTAGLRAKVGVGPMRMNTLVIIETTAGLGNYLKTIYKDHHEKKVIIGFDSRLDSYDFAKEAMFVLLEQGFKVYFADQYVPTPIVSFATKYFQGVAGIMITASHNPKEYNGYKIFWENGAQIIPPHDDHILSHIQNITEKHTPYLKKEEAYLNTHLHYFGDDIIEMYLKKISAMSKRSSKKDRHSLSIAYTPLHGVGASVMERAFKKQDFHNISMVESQKKPDGHFKTLLYPNPQERATMDAVIKLAEQKNADIAIANDPDADRLAVAIKNNEGLYILLNGDQIGILLASEELKYAKQKGFFANTIVSSQMLQKMCEHHGFHYFTTLTGFKWLANEAIKRESKTAPFFFGYEEALGYMIGDNVRDKDGISATLSFSHLAAKYHKKNIFSRLEELYRTYGLFLTDQKSIFLKDTLDIINRLKNEIPNKIAGKKIEKWIDLKTSSIHTKNSVQKIDLPSSSGLIYYLEENFRIVIRPSGTEPKLKCYYEIYKPINKNDSFIKVYQKTQLLLKAFKKSHQKELFSL